MEKKYLKVPEIAKELGLSNQTVKKLILTGVLKSIRVRRLYLVAIEDFEEFKKNPK